MNLKMRGGYGLGDAAYDSSLEEFKRRAVDPAAFQLARPGRPIPDPLACLKIQCGALSQGEAGLELLADCAFGGFAGVKSCYDPLCAPWCGATAATVARAGQPLPVAVRIQKVFAAGPVRGCNPIYTGELWGGPYSDPADSANCCGVSGMIADHPVLALAALVGGAWLIRQMKQRR